MQRNYRDTAVSPGACNVLQRVAVPLGTVQFRRSTRRSVGAWAFMVSRRSCEPSSSTRMPEAGPGVWLGKPAQLGELDRYLVARAIPGLGIAVLSATPVRASHIRRCRAMTTGRASPHEVCQRATAKKPERPPWGRTSLTEPTDATSLLAGCVASLHRHC